MDHKVYLSLNTHNLTMENFIAHSKPHAYYHHQSLLL